MGPARRSEWQMGSVNEEITVMDLFAGVGGMSFGLENSGPFRTVVFCEQNKFCQRVLRKHWPDTPIYDDVRTLEFHGTVDVITSGDPCQRDSRANANRDGETMWPYAFRQIRKHRPLYVIRENVPGNIETGTLAQVESDLVAEGYAVRSYIIPASAIGAAHNRSRTWTLAYASFAGRKKLNHAAKSGQEKRWKHSMLALKNGVCWVGTESPVLRRVDDVPDRLDRIRALGNSVYVPIVEQIGRAILEAGGVE